MVTKKCLLSFCTSMFYIYYNSSDELKSIFYEVNLWHFQISLLGTTRNWRLQLRLVEQHVEPENRIPSRNRQPVAQAESSFLFLGASHPPTAGGSGFAWFRANRTSFFHTLRAFQNGYAATSIPCAFFEVQSWHNNILLFNGTSPTSATNAASTATSLRKAIPIWSR